MYLEHSPTFSATQLTKAMTSWWVVASISQTRCTSKAALSLISPKASSGISPSRLHASHTANSTWSQAAMRASSVHTAAISGVE